MYEHFRNDFTLEATTAGLHQDTITECLRVLDYVSSKYEMTQKELSLIPYGEEMPELAKVYMVCKKMEGLSETTLDTYLRMLGIFFRSVRKPVESITANDIRIYLYTYQKDRGCSNRSLDKYRGYLSSFFSWATDEGYLARNPMKTIPVIKHEKKPRQNLTQLELEYLRDGCATMRERAIIEFLYSTGCRVSELSTVTKKDIDWNSKSVHLFGKGKKHRTSYLNAKAEVSLSAYLDSRSDDEDPLFVTERRPYRQLKPAAIEKIVRNIAARSEGKINKKITPHVLRHTTATIALQSGMPIEEISMLLGHEKIDTTMIYAHTSVEALQAGHRRHIV